tara:strand:- start:868 stop:1104 length:237 start_codon:yes stop_codon:yes gene_type:complete
MTNEKILLPAKNLNFEEALKKNRYVEIENETKYPALSFVRKFGTREYFYAKYPMWKDDTLVLIKLDSKPNQNFDPKNY